MNLKIHTYKSAIIPGKGWTKSGWRDRGTGTCRASGEGRTEPRPGLYRTGELEKAGGLFQIGIGTPRGQYPVLPPLGREGIMRAPSDPRGLIFMADGNP